MGGIRFALEERFMLDYNLTDSFKAQFRLLMRHGTQATPVLQPQP